ncbi:MAG: phage holin family protein [Clostridiaceae bacterium]|nr:phage holin family protein [Clostridiaceae bacterium]
MATQDNVQNTETKSTFGGLIGRLVAAAVVLAITAFFTPGFTIDSIWSLVLAAIVLSLLDYGVSKVLRTDASPFGRGITGFILAAVIIYATKFIVAGYNITLFGAIIAAIIFGIVDAIIPGKVL